MPDSRRRLSLRGLTRVDRSSAIRWRGSCRRVRARAWARRVPEIGNICVEGCGKKWCTADSRNPDESQSPMASAVGKTTLSQTKSAKGWAIRPSVAHPQCVEPLLLTGFTDHADVGD